MQNADIDSPLCLELEGAGSDVLCKIASTTQKPLRWEPRGIGALDLEALANRLLLLPPFVLRSSPVLPPLETPSVVGPSALKDVSNYMA